MLVHLQGPLCERARSGCATSTCQSTSLHKCNLTELAPPPHTHTHTSKRSLLLCGLCVRACSRCNRPGIGGTNKDVDYNWLETQDIYNSLLKNLNEACGSTGTVLALHCFCFFGMDVSGAGAAQICEAAVAVRRDRVAHEARARTCILHQLRCCGAFKLSRK